MMNDPTLRYVAYIIGLVVVFYAVWGIRALVSFLREFTDEDMEGCALGCGAIAFFLVVLGLLVAFVKFVWNLV